MYHGVKAPPGGDCNEGVKARPGQDVTMKIKVFHLQLKDASFLLNCLTTPNPSLQSWKKLTQAKVSQPDGRGKLFFDKPSFEIRFGKPNAKKLVAILCL